MGPSQVVSMQETGDASSVGSTPHLLSKTLGNIDAQPSMVMALLWTPLLCGEQTDRRPSATAGPRNTQPAQAFLCVRSVSSVLGGPEKDAAFPASSFHGIVAGARFVENFGLFAVISIQFGLMPGSWNLDSHKQLPSQ